MLKIHNFSYGSNFSHPNLGNQQTATNNQNSPYSQNSFFDTTNIIYLNDDVNELDDPRGGATQWTWTEDKLLISAWLNVSIDPLIGADKKGAQQYGACYEEVVRKIGSGTNLENKIAAAHDFHKNKYNKKSNFEKHWNDLKRHPKWRQPKKTSIGTNSGSAKKTKLSDSRNYSSSMNETPTDENVVESPVRPNGTKAAKRKGKGKAEFNNLKKK
ncbi:glutathione S-transferase T3-like [Apium graveolens]|uniref:glutathione S-transferase T3-like n=1 Tax=Apium graveolens TaxID=4045 RepID=UPI003D7BBE7A